MKKSNFIRAGSERRKRDVYLNRGEEIRNE
jgi:hypothetical protein